MKITEKFFDNKNWPVVLWIFPVLLPLLTIILSFALEKWNWGLMDDSNILTLGNNVASRAWLWFQGLRSYGQFKPFTALHAGIFYTLFEKNPVGFYIFRVFEISAVLFLWGLFAYRITRNILSLVLVAVITLSFHYFYDAFFYLSSSEIIALFFLGIAVNLFARNFERITLSWMLGLFFLLAAFASKETFVSSGVAIGLSYFYLAWANRRKDVFGKVLSMALILTLVSLIYGTCLFTLVKSGYTGGYSWDIPKFTQNFNVWLKKDFFNHAPWVFAAIVLLVFRVFIKKEKVFADARQKWGLFLGFLFYAGFFLILLPWNTSSYYAVPLGIFFAFFFAVLLSDILSGFNLKLQLCAVIFALVFNQMVCLYALNREWTYKYDTNNLMEWLIGFSAPSENGWNNCVQTNAMEPAETIPQLLNRQRGTALNKFHWLTDINQLKYNKGCDLYLHSPRFSGSGLHGLEDWEIVFFSKNWIMYKRRKG